MKKWKWQPSEWEEDPLAYYEESDDWLDEQVESDEISAQEAGVWRGARDWRDETWGSA